MMHPEVDNDMEKLYYSRYFDEISALNSQLVNMQRELAKKNSELEKANQFKNQFLSMMVHDLRNPASAMLALSRLLMNDLSETTSDEQYSYLKHMNTSSEFMLEMLHELVEILEIESGEMKLDKESLDVVALIERNIAVNRVLADKKRIGIKFSYEARLPELMIDKHKFEQVLNNLVSNAIKFSHPDSEIEVHTFRENEEIVIAVIDYGVGIPEHEMDKLFKPFGKTSIKGTGGEKSTGLGLAISKAIVEAHKGELKANSSFGFGSEFTVHLPVGVA